MTIKKIIKLNIKLKFIFFNILFTSSIIFKKSFNFFEGTLAIINPVPMSLIYQNSYISGKLLINKLINLRHIRNRIEKYYEFKKKKTLNEKEK